jgi:electron transfer flavoprotein alpha subunit
MEKKVIVFVEQREGQIKKSSLETLSEGKKLRDSIQGTLTAIIMGQGIESLAGEVSKYEADKIIVCDHELLKHYSPDGYAAVLLEILKKEQPTCVLLPGTAMGKDIAPRIAAGLETGLATDCIKLISSDPNNIKAIRPIYSGKIHETVSVPPPHPALFTLRPNVFSTPKPVEGRSPKIEQFSPSTTADSFKAKVVDLLTEEGETLDVTEANVVISGGRALKGPEGFKILEDLAKAFRGSVGASRAAVDAGWIDHQQQVGQTGKVVSPNLYIACGISGAIQHLAGMSSSKYIVAINKDPEAPIFKVANYGIVGDLFEVIPLLTQEIKNILSES